jgi:hypothetical protein
MSKNYVIGKLCAQIILFWLPARQGRTLFCDQINFNGNIAKQSVNIRKYSILTRLRKTGLSAWTQLSFFEI